MNTKIKHIVIEAELPKGVPIADLSRKYPETSFNITNGHWMKKDERIIYITSKEWKEEFFLFLKKHKSIIAIDRIGNIIMHHMKSRLLTNLEQKNMTLIYPTILKNGKHKIEFLINEKQLLDLKNALPECRVLQISDSYKPKVELTERQEEIVSRAQSLGYFKYPREVTLTELAKLFKISKATLSQTLRSVENKAVNNILNWRGEK
ncbi:helix-turn-helix domain-containing protein [Candidatus Woesearchaeota archaeon]|nr:helix-turn-helix domain-containing protein [Candidatus Woesearchaeota archaeon]